MRTAEGEMARQHHQLKGHESAHTARDNGGIGGWWAAVQRVTESHK